MSDTWLTPPAIIDALGGWESFDLDPCASIEQPVRTAVEQLTALDNGLLVDWWGRVWMNPPYSNPLIGRFMSRLAAHGRGTALVFARTDNDVFHRFVWPIATGMLFIRGRLRFLLPDGRVSSRDAGAPSVLISYGAEDLDILSAAPIEGAFMPLRFPRGVMVVIPESSTWADVVAGFMSKHDGPISLAEIYRAIAGHPKTRGRRHWQDKIRQSLQEGGYRRVDRGVWARA